LCRWVRTFEDVRREREREREREKEREREIEREGEREGEREREREKENARYSQVIMRQTETKKSKPRKDRKSTLAARNVSTAADPRPTDNRS
jgi:hypothetical protein